MGFFSNDTDAKYRERVQDEYNERYEALELRMKREARIASAKKDDVIADLTDRNQRLKTLVQKTAELDERESALDLQEAALDHRDELLDLAKIQFAAIKEEHKADMEEHHDAVNELQAEAKKARAAAADELKNAKSESRAQGKAEGYSEGYSDGRETNDSIAKESSENLTQLVKLVTLSNASRSVVVTASTTGDTTPSKAELALADAFAKHLTGTIEEVLKTSSASKKEK